MAISGAYFRAARAALIGSFTRSDLQILLREDLDYDLNSITGDKGTEQDFFHVLDYYDKQGTVDRLIAACAKRRPKDQVLSRLALLPTDYSGDEGAPVAQRVGDAFGEMNKLLVRPEVLSAARRYSADFAAAQAHLFCLDAAKRLHDGLHELQYRCYGTLMAGAAKLRDYLRNEMALLEDLEERSGQEIEARDDHLGRIDEGALALKKVSLTLKWLEERVARHVVGGGIRIPLSQFGEELSVVRNIRGEVSKISQAISESLELRNAGLLLATTFDQILASLGSPDLSEMDNLLNAAINTAKSRVDSPPVRDPEPTGKELRLARCTLDALVEGRKCWVAYRSGIHAESLLAAAATPASSWAGTTSEPPPELMDLKRALRRSEAAFLHEHLTLISRAIRLIAAILSREPHGANYRLLHAAKGLRLSELRDALSAVINGAGNALEVEIATTFKAAQDDLATLELNLRSRIEDHNCWQSLDHDLMLMESDLSGSQDDDVEILWLKIQPQITRLARGPDEAWAGEILKHLKSVKNAILLPSRAMLRREFARLREIAGLRFYEVDSDLLAWCERLTEIRVERLDSIVNKLGQEKNGFQ